MALIPWQPAASAARDGSSMCVTFGVILAQTGTLAASITQPQTSFKDLRVLAHRRAHPPLGQAVRAGEVALERIDAGVLAALDDLDPGVLAILLHDRGDQHAVGILVLDLLEFVDPGVERRGR